MSEGRSGVWAGALEALPLMLGYFPIAFSFGVAATRAGLSGWEAMGLSVIVFAGAAQFLAIALITGGAPVVLAGLTLAAMNLRHVLYGPVLLQKAGRPGTRWAGLWSFALTDEVFGAALGSMARGQRFSEGFMAALGFAAYGAWVAGTAAGAWAGGGALDAYPAVAAGLDFMLPALFLALLLSILSRAQVPVIVASVLATVLVTLVLSARVETLQAAGTLGLFAGMIAGAVTGVVWRVRDAG